MVAGRDPRRSQGPRSTGLAWEIQRGFPGRHGELLMSGYTDDALLQHQVREGNLPLLDKPFTPASLTNRIADILEETVAKGTGTPDECD